MIVLTQDGTGIVHKCVAVQIRRKRSVQPGGRDEIAERRIAAGELAEELAKRVRVDLQI